MAEINIHLLEETPHIHTGESVQFSEKLASNLACQTYGFDCNFIANGEKVEKVIKEFRKHTIDEHYIDYPEGVLMKHISKKK